jgi:hypothetical protein
VAAGPGLPAGPEYHFPAAPVFKGPEFTAPEFVPPDYEGLLSDRRALSRARESVAGAGDRVGMNAGLSNLADEWLALTTDAKQSIVMLAPRLFDAIHVVLAEHADAMAAGAGQLIRAAYRDLAEHGGCPMQIPVARESVWIAIEDFGRGRFERSRVDDAIDALVATVLLGRHPDFRGPSEWTPATDLIVGLWIGREIEVKLPDAEPFRAKMVSVSIEHIRIATLTALEQMGGVVRSSDVEIRLVKEVG